MNDLAPTSLRSRLARWGVILAACFLSLSVAGATDRSPGGLAVKAVLKPPATVSLTPTDVTRELMHDFVAVTPEAEFRATSFAGSGLDSHNRVIWMEVTAYCGCSKCCGSSARGITASGRSIVYNNGQFVAADTRLLPFGTQVQIPGYADGKPVEVIDRGGAIKGNHIDVFFPTHEAAKEWGRKWIGVTVAQ